MKLRREETEDSDKALYMFNWSLINRGEREGVRLGEKQFWSDEGWETVEMMEDIKTQRPSASQTEFLKTHM